jgi:hypothetical protein
MQKSVLKEKNDVISRLHSQRILHVHWTVIAHLSAERSRGIQTLMLVDIFLCDYMRLE